MKKIYLTILSLCTILLCACDSNKSKVEELTNRFVAAYNDGDKAAIYEILPAIKTCDNLSIFGTIGQEGNVSIEKNDSTGNYIATINEQKQQRLIFAIDSLGSIQLIDTYGIFRIDSVANELALKAGVPVKKLSDLELSKLMNPEGDFIKDIKLTKGTEYLSTRYGAYSWSRTNSGFDVIMFFTISNYSKQTISGKDYYLCVTPMQNSTGKNFNSKTIEGVDMAPNEEREIKVSEPYLYNYASERDLSYKVDIKYHTESILPFLLSYSEFDGNEYKDFKAHPYRAKIKSEGVFGIVNAEKNGFAYAYKEMSDNSQITDTLYHRKEISLVWETESWASVYTYDYELVGYMKAGDIDVNHEIQQLYLAEMKLKSGNGKVNIYDCSPNAPKDNVIKTLSTNKKVLIEFTEDNDAFLYERQPNGSMKKIGRIDTENIDYGDE